MTFVNSFKTSSDYAVR